MLLCLCLEILNPTTDAIQSERPRPICPQMPHAYSDAHVPQVPGALHMHILTSAVGSLWAFVDGLEQQLALRRREFRAIQSEMEDFRQSQEDWECLDIGGTRFHAGRGVLGGRGIHFFSMLVSNKFPSERASDGSTFIDRDPEHFPLILHYLREGEMHVPVQGKGVLREATYYGLQEFSATSCYLAILPEDGSAGHVYDGLAWQWLPCVAPPLPEDVEHVTSWSGRLTALVHRNGHYAVDVLDPISWTWKTECTAPNRAGRTTQSAAAVGSQLFYESTSSGHVAACKADGQWELLPRMTEVHRHTYSICAMGHGIAAVGGRNRCRGQFLCTVERFSLSEKRWERLPNMGCARCCAGAAMWQGKLVVVGGFGEEGTPLNSVEAYDPDRGAWQAMSPLVHAHWSPEVFLYAGKLIVCRVDPLDDEGTWVEVEEYDADAERWKVIRRVQGGGAFGAAVVSLPRK